MAVLAILREQKTVVVPMGRSGMADLGRTIRAVAPQSFPEIDKGNFVAQYWVGDAEGNPVPSAGTVIGGDATLRTDLANPAAGSSLVSFAPAGTGASSRSLQTKVRERGATLKDYGAVGDNSTKDQDSAANALASNDVISITPGTYRFNPDTLMSYKWRNTTATSVYAALLLSGSNKTIRGDGGYIRPAMRTSPASGELEITFATPKNLAAGTQTDITFDRVKVDLNSASQGTANTNQRLAHLVGVDRTRFLNPVTISTGARRGCGWGDFDNDRDFLAMGFVQAHTTLLANWRFCEGICVWGGTTRDANELFDFDGTSAVGVIGGFTHVGAGRAAGSFQVLDINGQRDTVFGFIAATDIAQIANVNFKQTTPPDYATYLAFPDWAPNTAYAVGATVNGSFFSWQAATAGTSGSTIPANLAATNPGSTTGVADGASLTWNKIANPYTLTPSQRVGLHNIVSSRTGNATNSTMVFGNEWRSDGGTHHIGADPSHDIAVTNNFHDDTTGYLVWEGKRLQFLGGALTNVSGQGGAFAWAFDMLSGITTGPAFEYSDLDATISDYVLDTTEKGGVRARYAASLTIRGLKLRNINTTATAGAYALSLTNLDQRRCRITVDECQIDGDINLSATISALTAWAASTAVYKNQLRTKGGNTYECTVSGTTASSGGPSGTGSAITDGTATWRYVQRPLEVRWGGLNSLLLGKSVVWGGDVHKYVLGRTINAIIPDLPASAATRRFVVYKAERRCIVLRAWSIAADDVAPQATNFRTLAMKSAKWSGGSKTETALWAVQAFASTGLTAGVERSFGSTAPVTAQELFPGDSLVMEATATGTGMALNGISIGFEVMDL